jgi:acetyl esterase
MLQALSMDTQQPFPMTRANSIEEKRGLTTVMEAGFKGLGGALYPEMMALSQEVENSEQVIKGKDDNDIKLYISKPKGQSGELPCILHTHGGGMSILQATEPNCINWRDQMAATGLVVVGVEFRNTCGAIGDEQGRNAFPAGLNDCFSALEWVNANKSTLNISHVVISGESGGGNLSIATTMKAKQEGKSSLVQGTYAQW